MEIKIKAKSSDIGKILESIGISETEVVVSLEGSMKEVSTKLVGIPEIIDWDIVAEKKTYTPPPPSPVTTSSTTNRTDIRSLRSVLDSEEIVLEGLSSVVSLSRAIYLKILDDPEKEWGTEFLQGLGDYFRRVESTPGDLNRAIVLLTFESHYHGQTIDSVVSDVFNKFSSWWKERSQFLGSGITGVIYRLYKTPKN